MAKATCLDLGDDVNLKELNQYTAFTRLKNFTCICLNRKRNFIQFYLRLDPETVEMEDGFTRNVSQIGHWGTGDVEVTIRNPSEIKKAMPLLQAAYEGQ